MLVEGWKREIAAALKLLGLVEDRYTGKVVLTIERGTITDAERSDRLK